MIAKKFEIPHDWALEEDGKIDIWQLDVDYHNGPLCIRCDMSFCHHCEPDIWNKACPNQDEALIPYPFTPTQAKARLIRYNKEGYVLRGGEVVGRTEDVK